jgi:aspartyl protease family protein
MRDVYVKAVLFVVTIHFTIMFGGCSGCSKSGLNRKSGEKTYVNEQTNEANNLSNMDKVIVQMENKNGVKYIWVEINGLRLKFIFDTGASNICISAAEATVLYRQGTLQSEDILDMQYFQDATGTISVGTRINIKTLKIGNKVLTNVEAIVIDNNQAPLLLGQSALEKFGKITIDNNRNIIIFE